MKILITNDDGIHSEGLLALRQALEPFGEVVVVAPDRPRSASGHSITLHKPLRLEKARMIDGYLGYASSGTPTDCVTLGIQDIAGGNIDLVVSGINHGPNLGWDITYSGTVSAAMEGVVMGVQSFAISVASYQHVGYEYAAEFAAYVTKILSEHKLPPGVLLNINVPGVGADEIRGIEVTRQGKRHYEGRVEKRVDPMGRAYYWLGGDLPQDELIDGTDVKAIADNKVSVTPIHLDLTASDVIEPLRKWKIDEFGYKSGSE